MYMFRERWDHDQVFYLCFCHYRRSAASQEREQKASKHTIPPALALALNMDILASGLLDGEVLLVACAGNGNGKGKGMISTGLLCVLFFSFSFSLRFLCENQNSGGSKTECSHVGRWACLQWSGLIIPQYADFLFFSSHLIVFLFSSFHVISLCFFDRWWYTFGTGYGVDLVGLRELS